MKVRNVLIENFRGIQHLALDLDDITVLIGENNAGKTAILDALRLCLRELGPRRRVVFDAFDFHLKDATAEPIAAGPIRITIKFFDDDTAEWDDQLVGRLNRAKILQVDAEERNHVTLRVSCLHNAATGALEQDWEFLNLDGNPLSGIQEAALTTLQYSIAYFYLAALRDAARHFDAKGQYWRPFLKDSQLPPDKKADIEKKLKEVNDLVVESHTSFSKATTSLKRIQDVVPMGAGEIVGIEAVPARLFDMLSKAQVQLGTTTGAKIPVGRHGEGTQSLAVLMLFSAFLDAWSEGAAFVAMEEPEAHLHPSAIRALWRIVDDIVGQKLISTHSGDLLSEVPLKSVRRLSRTSTGVAVHKIGDTTLTSDDERKLNFHVRHARGELLFARCWLLVEGETEMTLLPELARHLGINLERAGVRCVPHRHVGIELFAKVARDLGIKICCLADNDQQGKADQAHVKSYRGTTVLADLLHVMPEADIERHLCIAGFGEIYEGFLSSQTRTRVTVAKSHADYWPQVLDAIKKGLSKPAAAVQVVEAIRNGATVPPLLERAVRAAVSLAEAT